MMEGFKRTEIKTSGARIVTVHGGNGPPLLLMHGNPFTHLSWHKFAPRLAREFTVVATDLRGYGDSSKPPGGDDHSGYSFRNMALDNVEVMAELGFKKFMAAGHDRGGRVLHRMCLDHPDKVERAAILDIIPQHHLLNNVTRAVGPVLLALVLQHPARAAAREDDGRRSGLVHPEEARQDSAGPGVLRQGGARRIHALLPQSGNRSTPSARTIAPPSASISRWTPRISPRAARSPPLLLLWGATGGVGRNHKPAEVWARYASRHPRRQGAAMRTLLVGRGAGGDLSGASGVLSGEIAIFDLSRGRRFKGLLS